MSYLLGIDVGTSGAKALLIDADGNVVASALEEYPLFTPRPLWAEQNPEDWWQATVASIKAVLARATVKPSEVAGLGLTGQMHGMVALDGQGQVLRPCIMWNDQRTAAQCAEIMETVGRERFLARTGNLALPGFTAPKLLWVRQHEPDVYRQIAHVLLPKDYVRYRLTGEFAIDKADGAGTILFDLKKRDWSREVLEALEIPPEWLPPTFEVVKFPIFEGFTDSLLGDSCETVHVVFLPDCQHSVQGIFCRQANVFRDSDYLGIFF